MLLGVLALQGDSREHIHLLETLDVAAVAVRDAADLSAIDGLVIPGGESTTISKLLEIFDLLDPIRSFAKTRPVLGTCAGLILLSDEVEGLLQGQQLIGGLPIISSRNAYGGQLNSFEATVTFSSGEEENVAFIRAPKILDSDSTEVIARLGDEAVAVRSNNLFGASFHPELTGGTHLHKLFIEFVKETKS
ncbi:MAG: pyridoxal 5'-phosphate synthase glutaminase subunit PdxT [Aquiluna sp.]|nr:pyridoxal 5'-phosphate synthase glutaminase subunit PdxT [Aquiluna sp.]